MVLVNLNIDGSVYLVNGGGALAEKRAKLLRENGAEVKVVSDRLITEHDLVTLGSENFNNVVNGVFIVFGAGVKNEEASLLQIVEVCRRLRIPVNVSERPDLCSFALPSLHTDGKFQLAVSTNGMGCRLANRLRRVAVSALPQHIGEICANIGKLRAELHEAAADDDEEQSASILAAGAERPGQKPEPVDLKQQTRWLGQMVEYYPLEKLRTVSLADLGTAPSTPELPEPASVEKSVGSIALVGAGPGRASLLTVEATREINNAEYVLADKLVPEEVLELVPRHVPVFIARKFPGNAERAQQELLEIGLTQLQQGRRVVRLKQGDPYIFGRGLEEFLYFKQHGFTPRVVPGISSALAAPLLAGIPPTHRGYADQVLVCTGTGRAGKLISPPEFVSTRTVIFLMALNRIEEISSELIAAGWDPALPVCAIERASCSDQRVVRSTLSKIAEALKAVGSRPPGLLVTGHVCAAAGWIDGDWDVDG